MWLKATAHASTKNASLKRPDERNHSKVPSSAKYTHLFWGQYRVAHKLLCTWLLMWKLNSTHWKPEQRKFKCLTLTKMIDIISVLTKKWLHVLSSYSLDCCCSKHILNSYIYLMFEILKILAISQEEWTSLF